MNLLCLLPYVKFLHLSRTGDELRHRERTYEIIVLQSEQLEQTKQAKPNKLTLLKQ